MYINNLTCSQIYFFNTATYLCIVQAIKLHWERDVEDKGKLGYDIEKLIGRLEKISHPFLQQQLVHTL